MHRKEAIAIFLAIFALLTMAWALSLQWGAFAQKNPVTGLFFKEFDTQVIEGEEACFTAQIQSDYTGTTNAKYLAVANGKIFNRKDIDLSQSPELSECIPAELLSTGDNFVELFVGSNYVFYHLLVKNTQQQIPEPNISIEYLGNNKIRVEATGPDRYSPIEIFVNGEIDHRAYFDGKSFSSEERVSLLEGSNTIRAEFSGKSAETVAEIEPKFRMNPFVGIAVLAAMLCIMLFLVFAQHAFLERICYSTLSTISIIIATFFVLDVMDILSAASFIIVTIVAVAAIALLFRKNFNQSQSLLQNIPKKWSTVSPLLLLIIVLLLFSSLGFNFFTESYYSSWTVFYERQSSAIASLENVPSVDEFSFLGTKPFGYISAYFFVNAGISWLTGLGTQQSYAVIVLLAQISFIAAGLILFRSYGFSEKRSYLALIALFLGSFMFSDFNFNIRHVISYSFLFLALTFLRKGKALHAAGALAVGTFVQTPVFLMFLAALPIIITKKETIKTAVKSAVGGAVLSLLLFAPTLLQAGIPSQAEYNVWGYLWAIPLYGFFLDYMPLLALIALYIIPFMLKGEVKVSRFSKRVFAFLVLFVAVQLSISYRINVIATLAFALLCGLLFPKKVLEDRLGAYSLSILLGVTLILMFLVTVSFYPVVGSAQDTFSFVKENTSTDANFLNEPTLGHAFIHLAQRKSSADLAVEYANGQMIGDSFEFIKTSNPEILERYGIDYVINRSIFLDQSPVGSNIWHELLEHEELDKIYSNGLFFVHRVRKSNV